MVLNGRAKAIISLLGALFFLISSCNPRLSVNPFRSEPPTADPGAVATGVAQIHSQMTATARAAATQTPSPTLTPPPSPTASPSPSAPPPTLPAPGSLGGAAYPTAAPSTGIHSPEFGANPQSTWSYWENRNMGIGGPSSYSPLTYWRYAPQDWGRIPGYEICSQGKLQSPIDIPPLEGSDAPRMNITFHYQPADLTLISNDFTFQADVPPGSYLILDNARYELTSFTFHSPAEHRLAGEVYDFEIQFMHQNPSGQVVIVSVLLREGETLPALTPLLANMPPPPFSRRSLAAYDPSGLLPSSPAVIVYPGSLTTPPCLEGINWVIFSEPRGIDSAQLAAYQSAFPENARPVQPLHQRPLAAGSAGY